MNVEELKAEISRQQALHIAEVMRCFKSDPCASDYQKNYKKTPRMPLVFGVFLCVNNKQ
jgi:hypothetical protein